MIITFLIVATICYSLFAIFLSRAAGRIDANIFTALSNGVGVVLPAVLYFYINHNAKILPLQTKTSGIVYTLLAGISISIFGFALAKIFEQGGSLGFVMPTLYGSMIVITTIVGWLFFKEQASPFSVLGVCVIVVGVFIIAYSKSV
jgi:drug/metabolite transporter (DMT)-like permease